MSESNKGWAESAISFFRVGGHSHDGRNSSKIDLSAYSEFDIQTLRDALGAISPAQIRAILNSTPELGGGATVGGTYIGGEDVPPPRSPSGADSPGGLRTATGSFQTPKNNTNVIYIDVFWDAPDSNRNPHAGRVVEYEVEIIKSGAGMIEAPRRTTNTQYRFENLEPNVSYGFRVRAIDNIGKSSTYIPSSSYTFRTAAVDGTIPNPPTGVDLACGFQTCTLTWNDNTDDDVRDGRGQYHIQFSNVADFSSVLVDKRESGTITSFADLASGVTYYARIKAIDTSGNESTTWSATDSDTTGFIQGGDTDTTAPATPTGLALTTGQEFNGQTENVFVNATWNRNTESDMDKYVIAIRKAGGTEFIYATIPQIASGTVQYKFTGLKPQQSYAVKVLAMDKFGNQSAYTAESTITTSKDTTAPAVVANPRGVAGIRSIQWEWDKVTTNHDSSTLEDFSHYEAQVDTVNTFNSSGLYTQTINATGFNYEGAAPDTTYYMRVRAVDTSGNTSKTSGGVVSWSTTASATTQKLTVSDMDTTSPTTPLGLAVTSGQEQNGQVEQVWIRGAWTHVKNNDLAGYNVRLRKGTETRYDTKVVPSPAKFRYEGFLNETVGQTPTVDWIIEAATPTVNADSDEGDGKSLLFASGVYGRVRSKYSFPVVSGEKYSARVRAKKGTGTTAALYFGLVFNDDTWVYFSSNLNPTTAWTTYEGTVTIPAGKTSAQLWLFNYQTNTAQLYVDWFQMVSGEATDLDPSAKFVPVVANQSYGMSVQAFDRLGNLSEYTNEVTHTTSKDSGAPAVPTGLTGDPGLRSVQWRWTANTEVDLDYYIADVTSNADTGFASIIYTYRGKSPSFNFEGAVNTTYRARVRAVDISGNASANSSAVTATTQRVTDADADTTSPATPSQPNAVTTGSEFNGQHEMIFAEVTWTAVGDTDLAGYRVRLRKGTESRYEYQDVPSDTTIAKFTNLIPNVAYGVFVQAYDWAGNESAWSNERTFTSAKDNTAPAIPTGLAGTPGLRSIQWSWTANTEADLAHYIAEVHSNAGMTALVYTHRGAVNGFNFEGAAPGTQYWCRVKAIDTSANDSGFSSNATATTDRADSGDVDNTPPAIPTSLAGTAGQEWIGQTENIYINATWTNPGDADFAGAEVRINQNGQTRYEYQTVSKGTTSCKFTGLKPSTNYELVIRSFDQFGNFSNYSSPVVTVNSGKDASIPAVPVNPKSDANLKSITWSWDANTEADFDHYEAEVAGPWLTFDGTDDDISTPDHANLDIVGDMCFEAWLNITSLTTTRVIISKLNAVTNYPYRVYVGADGAVLYSHGGASEVSITIAPAGTVVAGEVFHLAVNRNNTASPRVVTCYKNGVSVGSATYTNLQPQPTANALALSVMSNGGGGFATPGNISDVRLWNGQRSAAQILANYKKRLVGNEAGLRLYWKLDEGSGTTVQDSTANNFDGTLNSGPTWSTGTNPFVFSEYYFSGKATAFDYVAPLGKAAQMRVRAVDTSDNKSAFTSLITDTPTGVTGGDIDVVAPSTPIGIAATTGQEGSGQTENVYINITWTANTEPDLAGYKVKLRKGTESRYAYQDVPEPNASAKFTNLVPNTSYNYQIAAYDAFGNISAYSTETAITSSKDSGAPAQITNLTATGGIKTVSFKWDASTADDLSYYELQIDNENTFANPLSETWKGIATAYTFEGAAPGTTYYGRVRGVDVSGNLGTFSATASAAANAAQVGDVDTTAPATPAQPNVPTGGSDFNGQDESIYAQVTWTANGEADLKGYRVRLRRTTGSAAQQEYIYQNVPSNVTQAKFTGLVANSAYGVSVQAFDVFNNYSAFSTERTFTSAADTTAPAQITGLTGTAGLRSIEWRWTASAATDLAYYEIQVDTENTFGAPVTTIRIDGTSYTWEGSPGTQYFARVRAIDVSGNQGTYSSTVSATTDLVDQADADATPPAIPTGLALTTGQEFNAQTESIYINATWTANSENDLAGYKARLRIGSESRYAYADVPIGSQSAKFTSLAPNTSYGCQVAAYDQFGNVSNWSTEVTITSSKDSSVPAVPSGLRGERGLNAINWTWNQNTEPDFSYYDLQVAGPWLTLDGTNDDISVADNASLDITGNMTFEAWIYITNLSASRYIISKGGAAGPYQVWVTTDGSVGVNHGDGSSNTQVNNVCPAGSVVVNTPVHIAITRNTSSRVYQGFVNGVAQTATAAYNLTPLITANAAAVTIGSFGGGGYVPGAISDVRLWNAVLSGATIASRYRQRLAGNEGNLVAVWRLDEGSGTTVSSQGQANFGGTIQGSAVWSSGTNPFVFPELSYQGAANVVDYQTSPAKTGWAKVRAIDTSGNASAYSTIVSQVPSTLTSSDLDTTAPATPTGLALTTAQEFNGQVENVYINATWNANTEDDLAHYMVRLRKGSESRYEYRSVPKDVTSVKFTSVQANTSYGVQVQAIDGLGNASTFSTEVTITSAKDNTAPAVPTGLAGTAGMKSIRWGWNANSESDFAYYTIDVSADSGFGSGVTTFVGQANSFAYEGAAVNTTYFARVKAHDISGNASAYSSNASATTQRVTDSDVDTTAPAVPTGLTQTSASEFNGTTEAIYVEATWNVVADSDRAGYRVRLRKGSETRYQYQDVPVAAESGGTVKAKFHNLVANASYGLQVQSYDTFGNESGWTTESTFTSAKDNTAPAVPTGLAVTTGLRSLTWTWNANSEADFMEYELQVDDNSGFTSPFTVIGSSNTYTFEGSVNTQYWARVKARDYSANESAFSSSVSGTTERVDATDADVTAPSTMSAPSCSSTVESNGQVDQSTITVTWTASGATDLAGYKVRIRRGSESVYDIADVDKNTLSHKFWGVISGVSYGASVAAYDWAGNQSAWSTETTHTIVADTGAPSAPTSPTASPSIGSIVWNFTGVANKDLRYYDADTATNSGFTTGVVNYKVDTTSINQDAASNTTYYFRVRAVDWSGNASAYTTAISSMAQAADNSDIDGSLSIPWEQSFDNYDANDWNFQAGSSSNISIQSTGGEHGGKFLRATGYTWMEWKKNIAHDPAKTYKMTARFRVTTNPTTPDANQKFFYAGVAGVAADGTTYVNTSGANSSSGQHYIAASSLSVAQSATWTVVTGYFKARGTVGTVPYSNPNFPNANDGNLHTNVRYFRPIFIMNYSGGNGVMDLDSISIEEMGAQVGTGNIATGSIVTNHMTAGTINGDRITTASLNADKIVSNSIEALQINAGAITSSELNVTQALNAHVLTLSSTGVMRAGSGSRATTEYQTLVTGESGIKGYWKLSETSGTSATDSGPNGLTGTYAGTYTLNQTGALSNDTNNKAVKFGDGGTNGGQVTVADNANLDFTSTFTIECWFERTTQKTDWQTIVVKENSSGVVRNYGIFIYPSTWTIYCSVANGGVYDDIQSPVAMSAGWNHIVYVRDGTYYKIYLNGALVAVKQVAITPPNSTGSLYIGNSPFSLYNKGNKIDEVAVYNVALNETQILEHYNAAKNYFQYATFDTNGIRLYREGSSAFTGGTPTVDIQTTTGNATFKGAINASTITGGAMFASYIAGSTIIGGSLSTGETGARSFISDSGIKIYSGSTSDTAPGQVWAAVGTTSYVMMESPNVGYGYGRWLQSPANGGSSGRTLAQYWVPVGGSTYRGLVEFIADVYAEEFIGAGLSSPYIQAWDLVNNATHHRYQAMWDPSATLRHYIDAVNVKNFIIDHPIDVDNYLIHTTLEGPENGVYYRGEGYMYNGVAYVDLPSYFEALTHVDNRTAMASPIDMGQELFALAASRIWSGRFRVTSIGGEYNGPFSWVVHAERQDVEKLLVEPRRDEIDVHGTGPYTYYSRRK